MSSGSTSTAKSGRFSTSSLIRISYLTGPIVPTLRPKLRKVARRSFSMAMANSALKIIRDKTAFHYDQINITEAAANLATGENSIYLAQHPANSLYYMGSALVFRAAFAMIADKAEGAVNGSHGERVHKGLKITHDDAKKANWHMHAVLYGLIKLLMDDVLGQPAENEPQVRINVLDAPAPERVGIPAFIDIGP
jgi:hypothetical protein